MNSEMFILAGRKICKAGASELIKVRDAQRFDEAWFPEKDGAAFAVTHRLSLGTLRKLVLAVEAAGYAVRGSVSSVNSHIVFFDMPTGE